MESAHIKVPAELFALAESSRFEGELDKKTMTAAPDEYRFTTPIAWQVDVTNTGEAFLIAGSAKASAETDCARCLKSFEIDFEGDIEGYIIIDAEGEGPTDLEDDEFDFLPADHIIDLEPLIMAGLIMDAPNVPLCKEDCLGLCPHCGADLNEGACDCDFSEEEAAFEEAKNPFAALKNFDFGD